jgi:hypothetical protein
VRQAQPKSASIKDKGNLSVIPATVFRLVRFPDTISGVLNSLEDANLRGALQAWSAVYEEIKPTTAA